MGKTFKERMVSVKETKTGFIVEIICLTIDFILIMFGSAYLFSISGLIIKILVGIWYTARLLDYVGDIRKRIRAIKLGLTPLDGVDAIEKAEQNYIPKE